MKTAALLAALPLASAFVAPAPRMVNTRGRSLQMAFNVADQPAAVKFFPFSPPFWDPAGLTNDISEEDYWRLSHGEIKNGRVAMLAVLDYLVKSTGFRFPFEFDGISTQDIPMGLGALTKLPYFGWVQIFVLCFLFDVGTEENSGYYVPGKVPGNVQPQTPLFKAPGDKTIRAKEINNGRLAMSAIMGIFAGELVSGEMPFETLNRVLGN